MNMETRAADLIERLGLAYIHHKPEFDFHVTQYLSGNHNKQMRREVIRQATGEILPLTQCGIFAVSNALKVKYDQLTLF